MNIEKFTQKSLEALKNAQEIAIVKQNAQVEQEHLLFALLEDENGLIKELLNKYALVENQEQDEFKGEVVKIHISIGKKKKIRALDILGCFSNLNGLTGEDIGIIDILDNISYVDILNGKGNIVLKNNTVEIKGKNVKIEKARK